MFKSIRLRLSLWYAMVMAVLLILFSTSIFFLLSHSLYQKLDAEIRLRAEHVVNTLETASGRSHELVVDPTEIGDFQLRSDETAEIFDLDGESVETSGLPVQDPAIAKFLATALQRNASYFTVTVPEQSPMRLYALPVVADSEVIGAIIFGRSTDDVVGTLDIYKDLTLAAIFFITLLAGAGGYVVTDKALRPVNQISQTARQIGAGDLEKRIEVSDKGEIGQLATTLNKMFDQLQAAFLREKRFTSDASHELRTPLAIIQAEATLALEKNRSRDEYKKALGVITQEAGHMSRLINGLLFLARSEAGKEKLDLKLTRLGDFIEELVSDVSVLARRKKLSMVFNKPANPVVRADETRLRQLFLNILENAIRYTPPKGTISISVAVKDNQAATSISDTGAGIPQEALNHLFEPFFRVDEGRSSDDGGAGLGLAIGKRIAEAHGGRIEVESQAGKGSKFSVFLPMCSEDQEKVPPTNKRVKPSSRFWPFGFFGWKL
jgi:heavy metal sensor kinase